MTATAAVEAQEGERLSCRGEKLLTVHYAPPGETRAVLIWHHGYGEHVGRYKWAFAQFAAAGIAVHSYDAHGHGRSESHRPKDRAYLHSYTHFVDDLDAFLTEVIAQYPPGTPVFQGAQSMGGLMTLHAVLRDQSRLRGVVLASALINVQYTPILRVQAKLGNVLATVIPRVRCVPAINPDDMSQDPAVVKDYKEDPLNFVGKVRARTGNELLKAMRDMDRRKAEIAVPLLAIHGTADGTTSLAAVKTLLKECASADATLKEYPGGYHELLQGPEKEDAVRSLSDWILSHSGPQADGVLQQRPISAAAEAKL